MVYIQNGHVVDKKGPSLNSFVKVLQDYVVFFGSSFLSNEPFANQVSEFRTRNNARTTYQPFTNILGTNPWSGATSRRGEYGASGSVNTNGGRAPTATGRPTVFRRMPNPAFSSTFGSCGGGG